MSVALAITKDHASEINGKDLFETLKSSFGLKGGGKPTSLAGTTQSVDKFTNVVDTVKEFVHGLKL